MDTIKNLPREVLTTIGIVKIPSSVVDYVLDDDEAHIVEPLYLHGLTVEQVSNLAMTCTAPTPSFEQQLKYAVLKAVIVPHLSRSYELRYVDRCERFERPSRNDANNVWEALNNCLHNNTYEFIEEKVWDWYDNAEWESVQTILSELPVDKALKEALEDEIKEEIYSRDESDVLRGLSRNTGNVTMFYTVADELSFAELTVAEVFKLLNICSRTADNERAIQEMLLNAGAYYGELRIYFRASISDIFDAVVGQNPKSVRIGEGKCIVHIGLVDSNQGTGAAAVLRNVDFTLPFYRDDLWFEYGSPGHSWSADIAGCVPAWCHETSVMIGTQVS